jgi:hypothetical protein
VKDIDKAAIVSAMDANKESDDEMEFGKASETEATGYSNLTELCDMKFDGKDKENDKDDSDSCGSEDLDTVGSLLQP